MNGTSVQCLGYQQLSVGTGAVVTLIVPKNCTSAIIRTETANIRFRADGTNPTTTVGMPILSTDVSPYTILGLGTLTNFAMIASSGTATVNVMYFG